MLRTANSPIRVLIADDHRLFREGLRSLLEREEGIDVVGEACDGEEVVSETTSLVPDVVLMDIEMPKIDGITATTLITRSNPNTKVLMLSSFDEDDRVLNAMLAGANGYVVKRVATRNLVSILAAVRDGEFIVPPFLAGLVLQEQRNKKAAAAATDFGLTAQEIKILELLVSGRSNKEISNMICISVDTVKAHLKHIFEKLGVDCRTKA
ncbi:MAG TPA: response regulator transcription factor, partial [Blastocatellia bacterium]|nr:response regulator transcription factor [Blastocatellia bacterium]